MTAPTNTNQALLEENARLNRELHDALDRARRDELTGLYRRWYFIERVKEDILSRRREHDLTPSIFALLDIKSFADFNDLPEGMLAGDFALRKVGEAMRKLLRQGDRLGRIGGDEFALWLPGIPESRLNAKIDEINALLKEADPRLAVYFAAVSYRPEMDFEDLYRDASALLREIKRQEKSARATSR